MTLAEPGEWPEGVTEVRAKASEFMGWLRKLAEFNRLYDLASVVVVVDPEGKLREVLRPGTLLDFVEEFSKALDSRTRLDYLVVDGTAAPKRPNRAWIEFTAFLDLIRTALCVVVIYLREPRPRWLVREGDVVVQVE